MLPPADVRDSKKCAFHLCTLKLLANNRSRCFLIPTFVLLSRKATVSYLKDFTEMENREIIGDLCDTTIIKRFEWKIKSFSSLRVLYGNYISPCFLFANKSMYLQISPTIFLGIKSSYYSAVYVYAKTKTEFPPNVTYNFSIKKSDGTLIGTKTAKILKSDTVGFDEAFFKQSDLKEKKDDMLPADTLTIVCDLKLCLDGRVALAEDANSLKETKAGMTSEQLKLTEIDLLSKNFKDLLSNKESCDTVLIVQDKEFKAHKSILIVRSTVFAAYFQHDTVEKKTGEVLIPDCDPDSFEIFLEYLYSGRLEDMSPNNALHLYYTSDKYNVQGLKTFCVKYLMQNLTLQNICDVVTLADTYDEIDLLATTQDFFNKNLEKILMLEEWKDLMKKNFCLGNKLLIEMSRAKK